MKKITKRGAFWLACLGSIITFLLTFWSAVFHDFTPYWIEGIGFFLLTYVSISEFSKRIPDINAWSIGFAIILGQLILRMPAHILYFGEASGSLMILVSCIIAILLAVVCYKDKRPYTFILSYIVLSLFNSCVAELWENYVSSLR